MIISLSKDIPPAARAALTDRLRDHFGSDPQITDAPLYRDGEASGLIRLIASALEWVTPFKAVALVFLGQLAKRAADDIWDSKALIFETLRQLSSSALTRLVAAIDECRRSTEVTPHIVVGLPFPDPKHGTEISFRPNDEAEIAFFVAHFVAKVELIEAQLAESTVAGNRPAGRIDLTLDASDGSFTAAWWDPEELKHHKLRIE